MKTVDETLIGCIKQTEASNSKFKKIVYISHPYGGKKENEDKVAEIIKKMIVKYPDYLFLSPIHSFSFAYHAVDYDTGMKYCLWLLDQADENWFFGDYEISIGCMREKKHSEEQHIPISIWEFYP